MFKAPAQISKIETTSDGAINLIVHTQELVPSDKAELMNLHNKMGWFVFSETGIKGHLGVRLAILRFCHKLASDFIQQYRSAGN